MKGVAVSGLVPMVAVALAAAAEPAPSRPSGGLYGLVMRGPVSPVCLPAERCDEPAANATIVLARGDRTIRVRTDRTGRYRVRLAPGRYMVRKLDWGPGGIGPAYVVVPARRLARLDFSIDTGIR